MNFYKYLLLENWPWFKRTLFLFGTAIIVGGLGFLVKPDLMEGIVAYYRDIIGEEVEPGLDLAYRIFTQNLTASLTAMFGGIVLGMGSFLTILVNGFLLGYVGAFTVSAGDAVNQLLLIFFAIAPHGIFEIPAIILAAGMGFKLGFNFLKKENQGRRWQTFKEDIDQAMYLLPLIVILLVVAALVEALITIRLVTGIF